jgi:Uma2 family endonuclease
VRVQAPFGASDVSEPEPDIAIVANGDYLDEHPRRAYLLIEVADSSLQDDRRIKGPLYAAAGVPEYWIVDLVAGAVEVHREPGSDGYASVARHGREATLTVPGFEDVVVAVGEIVP